MNPSRPLVLARSTGCGMSESITIEAGSSPLGTSRDGARGTNFAIFSQHATRVDCVCSMDQGPGMKSGGSISRLLRVRSGISTCLEVGPGQCYGYRMYGPYRPDEGHRFNSAKLLIDPYAKAISGSVDLEVQDLLGHKHLDTSATDLKPDRRDDAHGIPRSVVVDTAFDWQGDIRPETPWSKTVIYEAHVKGFTAIPPRDSTQRSVALTEVWRTLFDRVHQGARYDGGRVATGAGVCR